MNRKTTLVTLILLVSTTIFIIQSCKKDEVETNQPPSCKISSPSNGQVLPKGEMVPISVDANDIDGNITEVHFFVDHIFKGSATNSPYYYNWDITNENLGNHNLIAKSFDNSGDSNYDEITIEISKGSMNTAPTSHFTVSPPNGRTSTNFVFDASSSMDDEDPANDLQVRWDFDGNGLWDTNWDTNKIRNYQYNNEATYMAKLEVKDPEGLTDQYTNNVTVSIDGVTGMYTDFRDGQTYNTIDIGNQTWFAENLNFATSNSWVYNGDPENGDVYGRLYTWQAALSACPSGWRLPSKDEWTVLFEFLGGNNVAGGKMKETGTVHWNTPNADATNSSGFTALPAGSGNYGGSSYGLSTSTFWWSSTQDIDATVWLPNLEYNHGGVVIFGSDKAHRRSVRCFKD